MRGKHIRCISCKYAQVDDSVSDPEWKAYECNNKESEYYKALLNVSEEGLRRKTITWKGCECGKRREAIEGKGLLNASV